MFPGDSVLHLSYMSSVIHQRRRSSTQRALKSAKLNVRTTDSVKKLIERAAKAKGRTPTEYVIDTLVHQAEIDTAEASIITIAKQDQVAFMGILRRRGPLPEAWNKAREIAKTIRSHD